MNDWSNPEVRKADSAAYRKAVRTAQRKANDPRKDGYNYGAALGGPRSPRYEDAVFLADETRVGLEDSEGDLRRSWELDMAIRDVRLSCTEDEQEFHLNRLSRYL